MLTVRAMTDDGPGHGGRHARLYAGALDRALARRRRLHAHGEGPTKGAPAIGLGRARAGMRERARPCAPWRPPPHRPLRRRLHARAESPAKGAPNGGARSRQPRGD